MFYKKHGVSIPVDDAEAWKKVIEDGANTIILNMMRDGLSLDKIGLSSVQENDKILKQIKKVGTQHKNLTFGEQAILLSPVAKKLGINKREKEDAGADVTIQWCVNIAILLKLKVIENNDENGWLIMRRVRDGAEILI